MVIIGIKHAVCVASSYMTQDRRKKGYFKGYLEYDKAANNFLPQSK